MKDKSTFKRTAISAAVVALMAAGAAQAATVQHSAFHQFSANDLVGAFDGRTFGPAGNIQDTSILCGAVGAGLPACDADHKPIPGDEARTLWPIDSEFGFEVVPYAEAFQKTIDDNVWGEGWAGNIVQSGKIIGLEVSDAETDTFKVPAPLGTWCAGIGETAVKCSTERYVVMEHVLSCHETVPYVVGDATRADPITGDQAVLTPPPGETFADGSTSYDCVNAKFDNDPLILNSGTAWDGKTLSAAVADGDLTALQAADPLAFLDPNESTVLDDIAYTANYSITAKDDGKPLYRWGTLIKRPNDIRLYARMRLPTAWKDGTCATQNDNLGCRVTKAELYVRHNVTNNPNDQVRPEDMENEGAIGRLPGFDIDPTYGAGSKVSDVACYEGDGDFIPQGTVLQNTGFAVTGSDPYAWSEDLQEGITNGFATTVDREPFEWSYDVDSGSGFDGSPDVSRASPLDPLPANYQLLSGPRWRLKPGKFGQDVPGLEIPNVKAECAPPPYQKGLIKYEVGAATRVVLNMLDWSADDPRSVLDPDPASPTFGQPVSPLTFSNAWVDGNANDGQVICGGPEPSDPQTDCDVITPTNPNVDAVTVNGAPVTEDFDLSIYVKGDRKPTQLYYSWLILEYDDGNP